MRNSFESLLQERRVKRLKYLRDSEGDPEYQALLLARVKRDLVFFIETFCFTYDPRPESAPHHLPFILYPFQREYVLWLEDCIKKVKDSLTDKSRDMGVSWLLLTVVLHHWLFDPAFNALLGSRKETLVDNYQLDSLFGKLTYLVDRLPIWMLPDKFSLDDNRTHMKLINPESGNAIQGESANIEFSRQGRYTVIVMDEFAFWPWADSAWTATADSAPIRAVVSTPHGMNNKFADLRFGGDIAVRSLHWTIHPLKDDEWYNDEKGRRTPKEVAQELDLDYEASGNERVFGNFRTNDKLRGNVIIPAFEIPNDVIEINTGVVKNGKAEVIKKVRYHWRLGGGFDYGTRAPSSFHVYAKDKDRCHYAIWEWRRTLAELRTKGWQGSMVQAIAKAMLECPYYEAMGLIYADPSIFAPTINSPDGMVSLADQLRDLGVAKLARGAQDDRAAIDRTMSLWADEDSPQFKIFDTCRGMIDELDALEWDDWSEVMATKRTVKETIVDRNNHSWDDWKYYVMSKPPDPGRIKKDIPETSAEWFQRRMRETKKGSGNKLRRFSG